MNAGETLITRRTALGHAVNGVGALTLTSLLQNDLVAKPGIDARAAQFAPRAKRVIYLWMSGGPSQIDTFDPKPDINKLAKEKPNVTEAPFQFREHGQSGTEVSELLPHIAHHVDDLCVIRSMQGDTNTHEHAQTFTFTGVAQNKSPVPTLGNWVVYGLGCESKNLPALVSLGEMNPSPAEPYFLPAWTAGVMLRNKDKQKPGEEEPVVPNLNNAWLTREQQRRQLDLIQRLNRSHLQGRTTDDRLNARIESFERAFRMQVEATDAFDISGETEATKAAYGLGQAETAGYAERCMIARRLAERDVRFIVVPFSRPPKSQALARMFGWDSHEQNNELTPILCKRHDQPIAALLADLKQRGMLEDTLVVWGGEFGRTAGSRVGKRGREHNCNGYTMFLAGGGVKGGYTHGETGPTANGVVRDKVHVHDLNATILHLLGLDHEKLTYRAGGKDVRLTDVYGNVIKELFA